MAPLSGLSGLGGGSVGLPIYAGAAGPPYQGAGDWYGTTSIWVGGSVDNVGYKDVIDYVNLSNTGNCSDFGDLTTDHVTTSGAGGTTNKVVSTLGNSDIAYIQNVGSTGNAVDFGSSLLTTRSNTCTSSNGTRGLVCGGSISGTASDSIEYYHFDTNGETWSFGSLSQARWQGGCCGSDTRSIYCAGTNGSAQNTIDYTDYSTTGTSTDFGDYAHSSYGTSGCSDGTYAAFAAGWTGSYNNQIEYITIASTGNSTDFGTFVHNHKYYAGSTSNGDRGVWGGGRGQNDSNEIEYRDLSSPGNCSDFGDLTMARHGPGASSGN